jgi:hypothetical protein
VTEIDTTTSEPAVGRLPAVPRGAWLAAAGAFAVLAAAGGRYGFHRDELYFIEAGHHPAWGYPDQPPLVPLIATGWAEVTGGSLWAFRLVPALLIGLLVVVASLTSRAMGGSRGEQVATAVAAAVTSLFAGTGHLFSTTTFDILATATTLLLLIHALQAPRERELRAWLVTGLAAGLTMEIKTLVAFVAVAALVGLLTAGPREALRRPGPYLAALIAAVLAAPYLVWQAANGWPQLEIGRSIANGGSTSSADRPLVVPLQLLQVGPPIAVVMVVGLVALWRSERWRAYRWIGHAYVALLVIVVVTGGKPYYSGGLMLPLLAAGVPWVLSGARDRSGRIGTALALTGQIVGTAVFTLPIATPGSPLTAFAAGPNPDGAETIGWDTLVTQVEKAAADLPAGRSAILTVNYGEAGALDRARRDGANLPPVYSGQNGYGEWGPPPAAVTTVLVVGDYTDATLAAWFGSCRQVTRLDNGYDVDNEEQGAPVRECTALTASWTDLWPKIRRLS